MNAERRNWQRNESLLVLRLYCHTQFGKLHSRNPEIIELAEKIGRTPSAVAMKAVNFAHLDPNLERKGLSSVSKSDRMLWEEFLADSNAIATEAEELYEIKNIATAVEGEVQEPQLPSGPTESTQEVAVRRVQGFFRRSVLTSYSQSCAISGLRLPSLLIASHIIPWSVSVEKRADPRNGIALNSLYDKLFDKGYITFDGEYRVCLSDDLKAHVTDSDLTQRLLDIEGRKLHLPSRFLPDEEALDFHRNQIFRQ